MAITLVRTSRGFLLRQSRSLGRWSGGAAKSRFDPQSVHQIWIKRIGNDPRLNCLLLTGGPGLSHSYLDVMDSYFRRKALNIIITTSSRPVRAIAPTIPTFGHFSRATPVDEVDQVRKAIGGDKSNFCLLVTAGPDCWRWNKQLAPTRSQDEVRWSSRT